MITNVANYINRVITLSDEKVRKFKASPFDDACRDRFDFPQKIWGQNLGDKFLQHSHPNVNNKYNNNNDNRFKSTISLI